MAATPKAIPLSPPDLSSFPPSPSPLERRPSGTWRPRSRERREEASGQLAHPTSSQVEGADAIWPAVSDPRQHAWAAGAHTGDTHAEHLAGVYVLQLLNEVGYIFLQNRLHLGGRALACECHFDGLARDHDDGVEGLHSLTHFL
eukprot:scaffold31695_cov118-Isochrysis_galbana.AAC.3